MVILATVMAGAGVYLKTLDRDVHEICACIRQVEDHAKAEDWQSCRNSIRTLQTRWDKTRKWLMAVIDHREIDLIQEVIYEVIGYCDAENQEQILVKTGVLEMLFQHIPENEKITLSNIL